MIINLSLGVPNVKADILVEYAKTKKSIEYVKRKSIIIGIVPVRKTKPNQKNSPNCKEAGRKFNH